MVPPVPARVRPAALRAHLPLLGLLTTCGNTSPAHRGPHPTKPLTVKGAHRVLGLKLGYVGVFLVLPMFFAGVVNTLSATASWCSWPGWSSPSCSAGARGGRCRVREKLEDDHRIEAEWAVHQVATRPTSCHAQPRVELALRRAQLPQVEHSRASATHYPRLSRRFGRCAGSTCPRDNAHAAQSRASAAPAAGGVAELYTALPAGSMTRPSRSKKGVGSPRI